MIRAILCALFAAAIAALVAGPATLAAADAVMALQVVGFTAAIVVQIARDFSVLLSVALIGVAIVYVHRMSMLGFVVLAALMLACAEPLSRWDTAAAAWGSFRIVGRLSGLVFALTFASYLDALADRPRGVLRAALRFAVSMTFVVIAQAVSAVVRGRVVSAALARAVGLTIVIDDAEAPEGWGEAPGYRVEAKTVFERLAAAAIVEPAVPLRTVLKESVLEVGAEPRMTLVVRREITKNAAFDAFMPARFEIEPRSAS